MRLTNIIGIVSIATAANGYQSCRSAQRLFELVTLPGDSVRVHMLTQDGDAWQATGLWQKDTLTASDAQVGRRTGPGLWDITWEPPVGRTQSATLSVHDGQFNFAGVRGTCQEMAGEPTLENHTTGIRRARPVLALPRWAGYRLDGRWVRQEVR